MSVNLILFQADDYLGIVLYCCKDCSYNTINCHNLVCTIT
jgi:hypothetical protein